MAFLVQGEALIMFWSRYEVLWFVVLALLVIEVILVRMGIRIFNREELLGREIDNLNLRRAWRLFRGYLLDPPRAAPGIERGALGPATEEHSSRMARFYRSDVPHLLRLNRDPLIVVLAGLAGAAFLGWLFAVRYPLPAAALPLDDIGPETFEQVGGQGFLPSLSVWGILSHNVRSLLAAGVLGILSLGALSIVLLMAPIGIVSFVATQATLVGYNPLVFIGTFILPHGVVEVPAAILATAAAVRLGMSVVSPPPGMNVSQSWLQSLAHFLKLFLLVVLPLLALAAFIEVRITPQLVLAVYGN
jgi:uncharacterized membrane protein SpoIIM required for sporulation